MSELRLTLCLLSMVIACGCGDDTEPPLDAGADTRVDATDAGERVPEVVVFVPEGASATPVDVTIVEVDATGFPAADLVSPVYEIGPSGTTFDIPVTVGIPIDPDTPAGTRVELVRYDETGGVWETMPAATIVGSTVFAPTEHFTPFAVAQNASAPGCDNVWGGAPGDVAPLLVPGGIAVSPATRTDEEIVYSGPAEMALGSTWVADACRVTVSGDFGSGLSGNGAWLDFQSAVGDDIPQMGGAFSFMLAYPRGPYIGITDPCHAPLPASRHPYNLTIQFPGDCVDLCDGVSCTADDGNPCTADMCNPANGMCEQMPVANTCGSSGSARCVLGLCMVEVPMNMGVSGNALCAAEGLTCASAPVLDPPEAACLAFNPTATVSSDANGWRQSVYCDDDMGAACSGRVNDCHNCPACRENSLNCISTNSDLYDKIYASCVP